MIGLEVLRKSDIFEGLSDEELAAITRIASEEAYPAGARICAENEPATKLYIVREGRVVILTEIGRGKQTIIDTVTAGSSFGWSAIIPPFILTDTAKAMEHTRVIAIPSHLLRELCQQNCHICYTIMEKLATIISNRLRNTRLQLISVLQS